MPFPRLHAGSAISRRGRSDPRFVYPVFLWPLNTVHECPANQVSKSSPGQVFSACRQQFRNERRGLDGSSADRGNATCGCRLTRRSRTQEVTGDHALGLTVAVPSPLPSSSPASGPGGLPPMSRKTGWSPSGKRTNEGQTTLGIDSPDGQLEFRHGPDGKPTDPDDLRSRPQARLERGPRWIHLIDLDGGPCPRRRELPERGSQERQSRARPAVR